MAGRSTGSWEERALDREIAAAALRWASAELRVDRDATHGRRRSCRRTARWCWPQWRIMARRCSGPLEELRLIVFFAAVAQQRALAELRLDRQIVPDAVATDEAVGRSRDRAGCHGQRWLGDGRGALVELRAESEIVLAAVADDGWALHWASAELRADWAAAADDGWTLHWASAGIRADWAAMADDGWAPHWASAGCRVDRAAVANDGWALHWASAGIRAD